MVTIVNHNGYHGDNENFSIGKMPQSTIVEPLNVAVHSTRVYSCEQCDFKTHSQNCYSTHIRNLHKENRGTVCEICGKNILYKNSLEEHMRRHFNIKDSKCPECEKCFVNDYQMRKHIKRAHKPADVPARIYECSQCEKKFNSKSHMNRHQLIHTGKLLNCPQCKYATCVDSNLRKHCKNVHKIVYPPLTNKLVKTIEEIGEKLVLGDNTVLAEWKSKAAMAEEIKSSDIDKSGPVEVIVDVQTVSEVPETAMVTSGGTLTSLIASEPTTVTIARSSVESQIPIASEHVTVMTFDSPADMPQVISADEMGMRLRMYSNEEAATRLGVSEGRELPAIVPVSEMTTTDGHIIHRAPTNPIEYAMQAAGIDCTPLGPGQQSQTYE